MEPDLCVGFRLHEGVCARAVERCSIRPEPDWAAGGAQVEGRAAAGGLLLVQAVDENDDRTIETTCRDGGLSPRPPLSQIQVN